MPAPVFVDQEYDLIISYVFQFEPVVALDYGSADTSSRFLMLPRGVTIPNL